MAKRYRQLDSGLMIPNQDISIPKPKSYRPWYAGRFTPLSNRSMSSIIKFVGSPPQVLFNNGKIVFNDECCCEEDTGTGTGTGTGTYEPWPDVPECTDCDEDVLGRTFNLSVSAGSLTNGTCDSCPAIANNYTLEYMCRCSWSYWDFEFCVSSPDDHTITLIADAWPYRLTEEDPWVFRVAITLVEYYPDDWEDLKFKVENKDTSYCGTSYFSSNTWQRVFTSDVSHMDCADFAGETLTDFTLTSRVFGFPYHICDGDPEINSLAIPGV